MQAGTLVAAALAGSWRRSTVDLQISVESLEAITPLLLQSGGAALGYWRIRHSDLCRSATAAHLKQAYRHHALRAAIHEREIKQVVTFLRSNGLEPLLGKGWAIARLYPKHGLRPYGDIDLYAQPEQWTAVRDSLASPDAPVCPVDLHQGSGELDDRTFDDLYRRSELVDLGGTAVRILGPEDHLRLLCLHTLRHGAWRPLWLCDIGVALESRPLDFDWDYFLSGHRRRSDWAACAVGLAHHLLGVQVDDTPFEWRAKHLPQWLVPTVLRQWSVLRTPHGCRMEMATYMRHPAGLLDALRLRWPNAIEATIGVRGPFNELPRLPFQVGDALFRTARFLTQVPRSLIEQLRVRA